MLSRIKESGKWKEAVLLASLSICCLGLSLFRYGYTGSKMFLFLNWNLFLAFVPWCCGLALQLKPEWRHRRGIAVIFGLVWLAFFPNAPYILTDLFHLRRQSAVPVWFDLVLILSYAWTGLLYGFLSLQELREVMKDFLRKSRIAPVTVCLLFLSAFGIYLGRYLRWNSWDILQRPLALLSDIGDRFLDPLHHPRTWGLTFFLGILLNLMFYSFSILRSNAR